MLPILLLFMVIAGGLGAAAEIAELAVVNANIYTVHPAQPRAKALAVRGGRILAVGDSVAVHIGPATQVIDARGATVIPGLIDSHVHMASFGAMVETFDLRSVNSVAEVAAIVARRAAALPPGAWVQGRSWDQTNWGGEFPDHTALTQAAPDRPVLLTRVDGHAAWVNRKALAVAGITKETPDPMGGKIVRDAQGEATGILIDRAQGLVSSKIPPPTDEQIRQRLRAAALECARLGMTSVHDAGISAQVLRAYRQLVAAKLLPVRVYAMIGGEGPLWEEYLRKGPERGDFLTVRSIKLVADGAMGSRGAAFWQPYSDDPGNAGLLILKQETIERVSRQAAARGFQVATHAIGDRANRVALDAYGAVLGENNDKRFRIEHAQAISLPDFEKFRRFGVIASMLSTHATSDMRWAVKRMGPDRLMGAYAWRRMLAAGVKFANGSDFPVEDPNPFYGLFAAVTRQDQKGFPAGGWMPDQRLTRAEALHSFTLGGAYAAFEEQEKGSLEPGKLADFLVLERDLMTVPELEIPTIRVRMTVLGGRTVFGAQ
ncbi:MAG: amidohydrolase [Acidobacteriota bacterium]